MSATDTAPVRNDAADSPARSQVELEIKLAPTSDAEVPDFAAGVQAEGEAGTLYCVAEPEVQELSAIYFDTEDLRLSRAKITLRRRTGGNDAGWHIKLPASLGRMELHHPLQDERSSDEVVEVAGAGEDVVPDVVRAHVRAIVRDLPLVPIARVDNERHEYLLSIRGESAVGDSADGGSAEQSALAEFCDDHVTAYSYLPGGQEQFWREWEVEATAEALECGVADEVLSRARKVLVAAGATESDSPSKLVAALGDSFGNAPTPPRTAEPSNPAHAAVLATLERNVKVLIEKDGQVRRDEFDSIHQMRVATRELRSHLKAFAALFEPGSTDALDEALKQLARILGKARDAEVIQQQLEHILTEARTPAIAEAQRRRIPALAQQDYRRAHTRVVRALDDPRYLQLLAMLEDFLVNPPIADADDAQQATLRLLSDLHRTGDGVQRKRKALVKAATIQGPDLQAEETYHDLRKAVKKLRYVTEAVGEAAAAEGLKSKLPINKLYAACKQAQSSLGDVQDAVTARDWVLRKAQAAQRRGDDTFAFGVCYQLFSNQALEAMRTCSSDLKDVKSAHRSLEKKGKKLEKQASKKAAAKASKKDRKSKARKAEKSRGKR